MQLEYVKMGVLALSTLILVIATEANSWGYSDVDLRVAEKQAIPHYRRHSFEYPDINIKQIMQQRGMRPMVGNSHLSSKNLNHNMNAFNRPSGMFHNSINQGRPHTKSVAMSNHIHPHYGPNYMKKMKFFKSFQSDGKYKMKKVWQ